MAKQPKRPTLNHCKVTKSANSKAPWRCWFSTEDDDGRKIRQFKSFSTEDKAWLFAEDKDREICNFGVRFGDISREARRAFDSYRDRAAELRDAGGVVPSFERLVADALDAIKADVERVAVSVVTIAEGVAEFLAGKKGRVTTRHQNDLRDHLKRFAADHGDRPFQSFTGKELDKWIVGLRSRLNFTKDPDAPLLSSVTRNHYRTTLFALFGYAAAEDQAWCSRNPLEEIKHEKVKTDEPPAYSPDEAQAIMQAALDHKPELLPVLALGFFAGLRTSEAVGFDLGRLDFAADEFKLPPGCKTGPRSCPFPPACKAWLVAQPRRSGPAWIIPTTSRSRGKALPDYGLHPEMRELFELVGVAKIANGARHSFISHRCAQTRNEAQVADECGNSAAMVRKHYRNITTSTSAAKYFAIAPATPADNVLRIDAPAGDPSPATGTPGRKKA